MFYSRTKLWNAYSVLIRDVICELYCKYSVLSTEAGTQCIGGQMRGIHVIQEFPDILRPAPCVIKHRQSGMMEQIR